MASDAPTPPPARELDREADRRTLRRAAVVTVALVVVGAVSGSLFAGSPCRRLAPTEAPPAAVLALDALDPSTRTTVDALAAGIGPVVTIVDAAGAGRLASVPGGVAVLPALVDEDGRMRAGPSGTQARMTLVDDDGTVRTTVALAEDVIVVGDGATLYALIVPNRATGQVDALRPVGATDDGVRAGTCVDTAIVGSPLAFLLDARGSQLLLLRVEEDGDEAVIELRDTVAGRIWATPVALGRAPAGILGARTSGAIGTDEVVVARASAPDDTDPVVVVLDRADGDVRVAIAPADLADAATGAGVRGPGRLAVEVVGIGEAAGLGAGQALILVEALEDDPAPRRPSAGILGDAALREARGGAALTIDATSGRVLGLGPALTAASPTVVTTTSNGRVWMLVTGQRTVLVGLAP